MASVLKRLSSGDLITLFLVVAFPIHAWSIFMVLQDFQWVMERTVSAWDGIGYAAYSLTFALFESIVIFLIIWLLSFLLPTEWKSNKTIAGMTIVIMSVSLWAILNQLYFFYIETPLVMSIPQTFISLDHPIRWFYSAAGIGFLLMLALIVVPLFFINRSKKFTKAVMSVIDRLIILSGLYIVLDVAGIIVILIRNL